MKKYLIKLFSIAISVVFVFQYTCLAVEKIEIKYNTQDYKIEADGTCGEGFANISVLPRAYVSDPGSLTTELTGTNVIMKTVSAAEGVLDEEIILGENFAIGCYLFTVESADKSYSRYFVKSDKTVVESVASQFMTSDDAVGLISANISNLGFDTSLFNQYGEKIVDQLKKICSRETVNATNFTDMYLVSEGIVVMKEDVISTEELILRYSGILGGDTAEKYLSLPDDVKSNLQSVMPLQNFSNRSFDKAYNDAEILAKVNVLKTNAKEELVAYLAAEEVSLSDYNKLPTYYQGLLFGELTRITYTDIAVLKKAFSDGVANQKKQYESGKNDSFNDSGSGGGGGDFAVSDKISDKTEKEEQTPSSSDNNQQTNVNIFNDTEGHWAKDTITEMVTRGIVSGYADGSFKPDNSVTRAEFIKILSMILSLPETTGDGFEDVTMDKWHAPYVYAAVSYGIINGVSENSFAPDNSITRQDAAVILHRALSKKGVEFRENDEFSDENLIAEYAKAAVSELSGVDIIKGSDGMFRPGDTLSRAEAVTMLKRILIYVK